MLARSGSAARGPDGSWDNVRLAALSEGLRCRSEIPGAGGSVRLPGMSREDTDS